MKFSNFSKIIIFQTVFLVLAMVWGSTESFADPTFYSTSDPVNNWFVSTTVNPSGDGLLSSFTTNNFLQAVSVTNRADYIANNNTGTNGSIGDWTFFVFQQQFDLTGYDPSSTDLQFQWAADDSGQGFAARGTWIPAFSLNGGALIDYPGATPGSPVFTYDYSSTVDLSSGFVPGLNTIDFYVEGNGVTDGFELQTIDFTSAASPVPEPATMFLFGIGVVGLVLSRRFLKTA